MISINSIFRCSAGKLQYHIHIQTVLSIMFLHLLVHAYMYMQSCTCIYLWLTCSPHAGGILLWSTVHGLVPGPKQVPHLLSISVVHVAMHLILLGAPVARLYSTAQDNFITQDSLMVGVVYFSVSTCRSYMYVYIHIIIICSFGSCAIVYTCRVDISCFIAQYF